MDSTASDRSERKKRKFQIQQDDSPLLDEDQFVTECDENAMNANWVQKRRKNVRPVNVVSWSSITNNEISGVELKPRGPPRRHYFVSRVAAQVTTDVLKNYCTQKDLSPIDCREVPSRRHLLI